MPSDPDSISAEGRERKVYGRWWSHDNDDSWDLYYSGTDDSDAIVHGYKVLKAPKHSTPYAEYAPQPEDAEFIVAALNAASRPPHQEPPSARAARVSADFDAQVRKWPKVTVPYEGNAITAYMPSADQVRELRAFVVALTATDKRMPTDATTDARAVEVAARAHHEEYERLAPRYSYETREATRVPWDELPESMRTLMLKSELAALTALAQLEEQGHAEPT